MAAECQLRSRPLEERREQRGEKREERGEKREAVIWREGVMWSRDQLCCISQPGQEHAPSYALEHAPSYEKSMRLAMTRACA